MFATKAVLFSWFRNGGSLKTGRQIAREREGRNTADGSTRRTVSTTRLKMTVFLCARVVRRAKIVQSVGVHINGKHLVSKPDQSQQRGVTAGAKTKKRLKTAAQFFFPVEVRCSATCRLSAGCEGS